jgi:ProP effector
MGFEQLAELKKQLAAARAEAAPAKPAVKPANKPGARPARKPAPPRRHTPDAKSADAKPAVAKPVDAKPVDPVVKSIGRLQKRFPNAFPKNPAPKLPLKVGIFEDLVVHAKELSLSEAELRDAIKTWCRGSRYWKCLVEGAARVDLSGAEAGQVTAQEAAGAQRLQAHRAGKAASKAVNPSADQAAQPAADPAVTPPAGTQGGEQASPAQEAPADTSAEAATTATPATVEPAGPQA